MENNRIYEDIALRTGGDIYIGVAGPCRTGKSTFIKRFMETLVIPNIENVYMKERARDELPQSGSGRTIMTAEPKFVPEEAVTIDMEGGASFSVRLIDCVGYMVDGAIGQFEGEIERMVTTPWFDHEITMREAAEIGTRKVIEEHSTIGIVITTDGTITDIERENYIEAEERAITELLELGKPFIVIVNTQYPDSPQAEAIRRKISETYGVSCIVGNCLAMDNDDISEIIRSVLYEFPISELDIMLPSWVDALPIEHPIRSEIYSLIKSSAEKMRVIRDIENAVAVISENDTVTSAVIRDIDLGAGTANAVIELPRQMFYATVSEESGFDISDDGDLVSLLTQLSTVKREYDRIASALHDVERTGYGIVMPSQEEMKLEEPEIVRKGGRYSVRLKASAPSIHMIRANVETEVSPAVGGEKASEEIINFLLQGFEGDVSRIWDSNIFGKSLYEIAGEGLTSKIKKMPEEAQTKLRDTLQRIINEGSGGLICIIL